MRGTIGLIIWNNSGGIKTVVNKLVTGLRSEGLRVNIYQYNYGYTYSLMNDLLTMDKYSENQILIYTGSIPLLSALNTIIPKILFLHGFVYSELVEYISSTINPFNIYGGLSQLTVYMITKTLDPFNYYICHTPITCSINNVKQGKEIILPQFMLDSEKSFYEKYMKKNLNSRKKYDIVIYSSHAYSPRLLSIDKILRILNIVGRRINRKLKVLLIEPRRMTSSSYPYIDVEATSFMPRKSFLNRLSSSYLFFETCIDEELRYSSIEASAMGIPVAKYTLPSRLKYIDYKDNLLTSSNLHKLVELLIGYYSRIDYYYEYYAWKAFEFVWSKRVWSKVSKKLLKVLEESINE